MDVSVTGAIQITIAGLATGSVYALILLGVLLVFRVSKAVNFAHGQMGMIGAYAAYAFYRNGAVPVWLALLTGLVLATVLAWVTERVLIDRLARRGRLDGQDLVITLGMMLLLTAAAETMIGTQTKSYVSLGNDVQVNLGDVFVNLNQVVVFVTVVALLGLLALFLKTGPGTAMRASAMNPDLAKTFGVDVARIKALTWAASGFLAGIAGIILASRLSVNPYYMTAFLISGFIAGIIGGLDRFAVPLLIAFGLALYQNWSSFLLGADTSTASLFILVILLLAVLPRRFLDERREARA